MFDDNLDLVNGAADIQIGKNGAGTVVLIG